MAALATFARALGEGCRWFARNWAGLVVMLTQWVAIVLAVQRRRDADFVVWIWGVVSVIAGAVFLADRRFNTVFWKTLLTVFGALVAVAGYFLLP
jgi:hypothetical protein